MGRTDALKFLYRAEFLYIACFIPNQRKDATPQSSEESNEKILRLRVLPRLCVTFLLAAEFRILLHGGIFNASVLHGMGFLLER